VCVFTNAAITANPTRLKTTLVLAHTRKEQKRKHGRRSREEKKIGKARQGDGRRQKKWRRKEEKETDKRRK